MTKKTNDVRLTTNDVKVTDPSQLVQYQSGTVVSAQTLKKKNGMITLFAFDKGEGLSEHTSPYDATAYILDGEAKIKIAGRPFLVKKGESLTMPANKPHELKAEKRFKMMLVMIK